jgi:hypothetical protein
MPGPVAEQANPVNRPGTTKPWGADQAQQPHEAAWALRRLLSKGINAATIRPADYPR